MKRRFAPSVVRWANLSFCVLRLMFYALCFMFEDCGVSDFDEDLVLVQVVKDVEHHQVVEGGSYQRVVIA